MGMFGVFLLLVIGLGFFLFLAAASGGAAAKNNSNDAVDAVDGDDDDDGFFKPELNKWIFVPGSVPHTLFMEDDD